MPPVPGHSNDNTDASLGTIPDISQIAVNPDGLRSVRAAGRNADTHCDLTPSDPGANAGDAAAVQGFAAQLGFRVPNIIVSPFTRRHYVSHTPMDHTAVIKFVENRFIGSSAHLTARDAAQPDLLEFFDFTNVPWATPPTAPTPASPSSLGLRSVYPVELRAVMGLRELARVRVLVDRDVVGHIVGCLVSCRSIPYMVAQMEIPARWYASWIKVDLVALLISRVDQIQLAGVRVKICDISGEQELRAGVAKHRYGTCGQWGLLNRREATERSGGQVG